MTQSFVVPADGFTMFTRFLIGLRQFIVELRPGGRIPLKILLQAEDSRYPVRRSLHLCHVPIEPIRFL